MRCAVVGCQSNDQAKGFKESGITFFPFPNEANIQKAWKNACNLEDTFNIKDARVCSKHFKESDYLHNSEHIELLGSCSKNYRAIKPDAIPSEHLPKKLYIVVTTNTCETQNSKPNDEAIPSDQLNQASAPIKQEVNDLETIDKFQCRTCLKSTEATACIPIDQNFFSYKTAKEMIILLVPEMDSKLRDDEVVCGDCMEVLKSTMQFIEKCLEVEAFLTKKEQNEKEAVFLETCKLEMEEPQDNVLVDDQHNCCVKIEADAIKNETEDEIQEDNASIEYVDIPIATETLPQCNEKEPKPNAVNTPLSNIKVVAETSNKKKKHRLSCSTCLQRFPTKEAYKEHLEIHPPHSCDVCGKAFTKRESLRAHKFTHNDPNSFLCEVCGKGFKDRNTLRHHIKIHTTSEKTYACDKCPKLFKTKQRLSYHVRYIHDKVAESQCTICGKMICNMSILRIHMRVVHSKEKPYECDICQRRFGRMDYLRNHKSRHAGEGRLGSNSKNGRPKRYNTPNPEEPLPCKFCDQKCKGVSALRQHLLLHLKRFPCKFCPLTFANNARLKRHEDTHEGGTVSFIRCNVCWKKFKTKEALDKHVALHDKPRHSCDLCGEPFNRKFLLIQHKLTEHNDNPDTDKIDSIIKETLQEAGVLST